MKMLRVSLLSLIVLFSFYGCSSNDSINIVDECYKAPKYCWGKRGVNPLDVEMCNKLFKCYDWSIGVQ